MRAFAFRRPIGVPISLLVCLVCLMIATSAAAGASRASAGDAAWPIDADERGAESPEETDNQPLSLSIVPAAPVAGGATSTESVTVAGCAVTALPNDGSTSGNERAPNLRNRFGRSVYLILQSELSAAGIAPGTVLSGIGWSFQTAPGSSGSGPLTIYMENTNVSTNNKSTTWATAILPPMQVVHNAITAIPNVAGPFDITFSGGTPFTYSGDSLYVAFDAQVPVGSLSTTTSVWCNSTGLPNGLKGAQSDAAAPTTIAASSFRPETRLTPATATILHDASVDHVLSYGAVPRDLVGPQVVQAVVTNKGANALTDLPVTLTVTGAAAFANTQSVASLSPCGGQATVTFVGFTASTLGSDTLTVTVPADDLAANNSKGVPMDVTAPQYSFKYPGTTRSGGVGLTGGTGTFVSKFTTTFATRVTGVTLEFAAASATAYRVAIYADSGTGTPGSQIYLDGANRTVTSAGPVTLGIGPVDVGPGDFFVGIQQWNTTNASLSFDNEVPVRSGRFYLAAPLSSTTWVDFAPGNDFKLNIGVILDPCWGGPAVCDDGNPCTDDTCGAAGCVHTNNIAPCDDGNFCTQFDMCADGFCVPGPPLNCDDGNPCTDDFCGPTGCDHVNNSAACNDGDICTDLDTCVGGVCIGAPSLNCGGCCTFPGCQVTTQSACASLGGTYAGPASTCWTADCTEPDLCIDPLGAPPRPFWHENQTPAPTYPDYATMSNNFNFRCSIMVLASMISKAMEDLDRLTSPAGENDIQGDCYCDTASAGRRTRSACETACIATNSSCDFDSNCAVWLPTDIFKRNNGTALFVLKQLGWLDQIRDFVEGSGLATQLAKFQTSLGNLDELTAKLLKYVDEFTDGYNLGGYTTQRPDLHLCVGYGGHYVSSKMLDLAGGSATIESRYRSENLSAVHRAQKREAGFEVTAFDKHFQMLPGIEANIQIDGLRPWDARAPFGVALGSGWISPGDIERYDVFHLVDEDDVACLDTDLNQRIYAGELLINDYDPFEYLSASDNQIHEWPRLATVPENPYGWETRSTSVLSAGLELEIEPKPLHKSFGTYYWGPFSIQPFFDLGWGLHWFSGGNILRQEVIDAINDSIPNAAHQVDETIFARKRWPLQADDLTADDGTSAKVTPTVGAKLNAGLTLSDHLTLGLTFRVAVGADIVPRAAGGLVDAKYALVDALNNSNPPVGLPCRPIYTYDAIATCSDPEGGRTYSCAEGQHGVCSVTASIHCADSVQCPAGETCVISAPCEDYGYCIDHGVRTDDTTRQNCVGNAPPPATNPDDPFGVCCTEAGLCLSGSCIDPRGTFYPGIHSCGEVNDCNLTRFVPYTCTLVNLPVVSGWEGPGCHPLTNGFPSACGCETDGNCAAGETCSAGRCTPSSPDHCSCTTNSQCLAPRVCDEGACVLPCTTTAECGPYRACVDGTCASAFKTPFAESIAWAMKEANQPTPAYAVSTFALSDLSASAFLSGAISLGAHLHIFGWDRDFTLFDYSHVWDIGSPSHKVWYQAGLQAEYENQCWTPNLGLVTNWQPSQVYRYPGLPPDANPTRGNAGNWDALIDWCKPELPNHVADPDASTNGGINGSLDAVEAFGEEIARTLWNTQSLCIDGQPLSQYLESFDPAHPDNSKILCHYTYAGNSQTFPCRDLGENLLKMWGCLDANANAAAVQLAAAFPSMLTTYQGHQIFDLTKILKNPQGEFALSNIQSSILSTFPTGYHWYNSVKGCFESHYAALQPGEISFMLGSIGPCCGDGVLQAGEQCDDGNTVGGDGCSALCQLERGPCPDGGPPYVNYLFHDLELCHSVSIQCQPGCTYFECNEGCGCLCPPDGSGDVVYPGGPVGDVGSLTWTSKSDFSWPPTDHADRYDVQRGLLPGLRIGDYGTCFEHDLAGTAVTDPAVPTINNGFLYLVRGVNSVGPGSFGTDSTGYDVVNRNPAGCP